MTDQHARNKSASSASVARETQTLNGSWRDMTKAVVLIFAAVVCLAVAGLLIWFSYTSPNPSAKEGLYKDVITFILSFIGSVIVGYWFARLGNLEKVDTIAERSTEKMVLLSLQLENLRSFLDETETVAQKELRSGTATSAIYAYRYRTQSASHLISILANSNETFRSDWLGVVSSGMKQQIENKYEKLRVYFDANLKLREGMSRHAETWSPDGELREADRSIIQEAQRTIEEVRKDLPIATAFPTATQRPPPGPRAVVIEQKQDTTGSADIQSGYIKLSLKRDVFMATGTGKLIPTMSTNPYVTVDLVAGPPGIDVEWTHYVGVGTNFDFNVKIKSSKFGKYLPVGDYEFRYVAKSRQIEPSSIG